LKKWVLQKKLTTKVEDIKPGKMFNDKMAEFTKLSKEWQDKLTAFQAAGKKPTAEQDQAHRDMDIFSVTDVNDVGGGVPLFEHFTFEDWELCKLRFEFCVLVLCFQEDANDPDRTGIPVEHFNFYFSKYFKRTANWKMYGLTDVKEVLALIKDTITIKDGLLVSQLSDDLDNLDIFVKLSEEHRRERQRRVDAGDEGGRLKFVAPAKTHGVVGPKVGKPARG